MHFFWQVFLARFSQKSFFKEKDVGLYTLYGQGYTDKFHSSTVRFNLDTAKMATTPFDAVHSSLLS